MVKCTAVWQNFTRKRPTYAYEWQRLVDSLAVQQRSYSGTSAAAISPFEMRVS